MEEDYLTVSKVVLAELNQLFCLLDLSTKNYAYQILKSILNPNIGVVISRNGVVIYANQGAQEITGYNPAGKSICDFTVPEQVDRVCKMLHLEKDYEAEIFHRDNYPVKIRIISPTILPNGLRIARIEPI
jgi:PAS domain-containing protein